MNIDWTFFIHAHGDPSWEVGWSDLGHTIQREVSEHNLTENGRFSAGFIPNFNRYFTQSRLYWRFSIVESIFDIALRFRRK